MNLIALLGKLHEAMHSLQKLASVDVNPRDEIGGGKWNERGKGGKKKMPRTLG